MVFCFFLAGAGSTAAAGTAAGAAADEEADEEEAELVEDAAFGFGAASVFGAPLGFAFLITLPVEMRCDKGSVTIGARTCELARPSAVAL